MVEVGPEHFGKAQEALRVAVGVQPWGGLAISVCFAGHGLDLLHVETCPASLQATFNNSLIAIHEAGIPILCLRSQSNPSPDLDRTGVPIRNVSQEECLDIIGQSDIVMRYAV